MRSYLYVGTSGKAKSKAKAIAPAGHKERNPSHVPWPVSPPTSRPLVDDSPWRGPPADLLMTGPLPWNDPLDLDALTDSFSNPLY